MGEVRFDIVSDTHRYLSPALLRELEGADIIIHAGDVCSLADFRELEAIAPVYMCLGNNDRTGDYGPDVGRMTRFFRAGLRWQICHYRERLDFLTCDIAVCGHTHKPYIDDKPHGGLVINPGSPTFPRTPLGATMARVYVMDGKVVSASIVQL